jgi:hypothetical protein
VKRLVFSSRCRSHQTSFVFFIMGELTMRYDMTLKHPMVARLWQLLYSVAFMVAFMIVVVFGSACTPATSSDEVKYEVQLRSENNVPTPLTNEGTGTLNATYNKSTKVLNYTLTWNLTRGNATAAHFHGPAPATANAGIRVPIFTTAQTGNTGTFTATATLTADQETELLAGNWYCNLHSNQFPAGAMRGQMIAR